MNEVMSNLASRWKRLGGAIIDSIISIAIMVPIMMAAGVFASIRSGEGITISQQIVFFVIGWVFFLIINGYLLFKRGQTVGKVVVKTKIVDGNGSVPDFKKLLVFRYLILSIVTQIPIIGTLVGLVNVLFIFGKQRRCLHDYMAGTWVINA